MKFMGMDTIGREDILSNINYRHRQSGEFVLGKIGPLFVKDAVKRK